MAGSIFERYGGFTTIRKIVSDFYDKVLDSPLLSHHFERVDMRDLIQHQTQFISFVTGGPGANYSDDLLQRVHLPLGITNSEFKEMLTLLRETLEEHGFEDADAAEVETQMRARQHVIVTRP